MNALLLDDRSAPSFRRVLGACLARAGQADFAVARIRLRGIDLTEGELAGLDRCRVLVGRLDVEALARPSERSAPDAVAGSAPDREPHSSAVAARQNSAVAVRQDSAPDSDPISPSPSVSHEASAAALQRLQRLIDIGRLEVRSAGLQAWSPDFSVLNDVAGLPGGRMAFIGAHYFARPYPTDGPAFTCVLTDAALAANTARRFEQLWRRGYDVADVVRTAIDRARAVCG